MDNSLNNGQLSTAKWFAEEAIEALIEGQLDVARQLLENALAYIAHYKESKRP